MEGLFNRILWSIVSNAFEVSRKILQGISLFSNELIT